MKFVPLAAAIFLMTYDKPFIVRIVAVVLFFSYDYFNDLEKLK